MTLKIEKNRTVAALLVGLLSLAFAFFAVMVINGTVPTPDDCPIVLVKLAGCCLKS